MFLLSLNTEILFWSKKEYCWIPYQIKILLCSEYKLSDTSFIVIAKDINLIPIIESQLLKYMLCMYK